MSEEQPSPVPVVDTSNDDELAVVLAKHKIPAEKVAELRGKFRGGLWVLVDHPVIFVKVRNDQIERLSQVKEKDKYKASRELACFLVKYPEPARWLELIADDAEPLMWTKVLDAATQLATDGRTAVDVKKL